MSANQIHIDSDCLLDHLPVLSESADSIMSFVATLNSTEIIDILKVSGLLASKILRLAYDFPMKETGYQAINAFCGDAYKSFDAQSLSTHEKQRAESSLRIISSVYGLLKPDDIIKPYRLDFNRNIGPDFANITKYLKPKITIQMVKFLKSQPRQDLICLLPGDALKCLDLKIIRAFSNTYQVCFLTHGGPDKFITPSAPMLKSLRGKMARFILQHDIQTYQQLINTESNDFIFSPTHSKPGLPVFIS